MKSKFHHISRSLTKYVKYEIWSEVGWKPFVLTFPFMAMTDPMTDRLTLLCIRRTIGKNLWDVQVPAQELPAGQGHHPRGGGIPSNPRVQVRWFVPLQSLKYIPLRAYCLIWWHSQLMTETKTQFRGIYLRKNKRFAFSQMGCPLTVIGRKGAKQSWNENDLCCLSCNALLKCSMLHIGRGGQSYFKK